MKEKRTNTRIVRMGMIAVVLLLSQSVCIAQTAFEQITAEVARLRQLLPALKLSNDDTSKYVNQLDLVETATRGGNLYKGMYYLQVYRTDLLTREYIETKGDLEKQGKPAFESEWLRAGQELATKRKQLATRADVPIAVQALIESSLTQVQPFYQSARMWGDLNTIDGGISYTGQALASLDFAVFCQQLKFGKRKAAPRLVPIDSEIAMLEAAAIKGFQDPANASKQVNFIQVNATLKMARELNAGKQYAGAFKKYLDALMAFGSIDTPVPEASRVAGLEAEAKRLQTRLLASSSDQSIGLIYVEMALTAKSDVELKRAAVIVGQVLPAYFKYEGETNP